MIGLVHLAAEKAAFSTLFARAPQLKVIMPRVLNIQFAYRRTGQYTHYHEKAKAIGTHT